MFITDYQPAHNGILKKSIASHIIRSAQVKCASWRSKHSHTRNRISILEDQNFDFLRACQAVLTITCQESTNFSELIMGIACSKQESNQDDALLAAIRDGDEQLVRQVSIALKRIIWRPLLSIRG
jgi:hypothetical protein